jgi:8-oxo-dGTP diphosphatase
MSEFLLVQVVAGVVIRKNDTFLLVQERKPKAYGLWSLPAGRVNEGETFENAAIREAQEETGLEVKLGRKLNIVHTVVDGPVFHAYQAHIIGGELSINQEELLDIQWLTLEKIKQLHKKRRIRNGWVIESITQSME